MKKLQICLGLIFLLIITNIFGQKIDYKLSRSPSALLNQYYTLKKSDPFKAKIALDILLRQYPDNLVGLKEMGYWYLQQKQPQNALSYFKHALQLQPDDFFLALQIGYILSESGQQQSALNYFEQASHATDPQIKQKAMTALDNLKSSPAINSQVSLPVLPTIIVPTTSNKNYSLDQFYALKKTNVKAAEELLVKIIKAEPSNRQAILEYAYLLLQQKQLQNALGYFQHALQLQPDDFILALQIGYILSKSGQQQSAMNYFEQASHATDPQIKQKAMTALNNLKASKTINSQVSLPTLTAIFASLIPNNKNSLDQFYALKKTNIMAAKELLIKIIKAEPSNRQAILEYAYLLLQQKQQKPALINFQKAYALQHEQRIAKQIKYLLAEINNKKIAKKSKKEPITPTTLLNKYYQLKKTNLDQAEKVLRQLLKMDPNNINALKELGYIELKRKNYGTAYQIFKKVYDLNQDPIIAAQIGYILNITKHNHEAYHYFELATKTKDPIANLKYNQALTNLAGWQTKILPNPYFVDLYTSPLYYSRFDLDILPVIARAGVTVGDDRKLEFYASNRSTWDNNSVSGISPQIYEDDVAIFGLGARYYPLKKIPLYLWLEVGQGYDLIYRNRPRWRGDIRGGAAYQNIWGIKPTYVDHLTFPLKFVNDGYGEATDFSRYHNFIATWRMRPGIRLVELGSAFVDTYVDTQIIGDTMHQYYNNYFEWGPGIVIVPNNRYNFDIRFESVHGYYFNVDSPDVNPYGSQYTNRRVFVDFYIKF